MKIAIIGRSQILYETALKLGENGHQICVIITAKAAPEYSRKEEDFKKLAQKYNAQFFVTTTLKEKSIQNACKGLDIGISINWISIIRQEIINSFHLGILNAHHGDLPRYRGNACSNWALINNEKQVTNTIHFVESDKLDCGRIICQEHYPVNKETTITDIYQWTEQITPLLFLNALDELQKNCSHMLKYASLEDPSAFRCYPRRPEDGFIEWTWSVKKIHNLIRAVCHPFSGAYTFHWCNNDVKKLFILKSRIVNLTTQDLAIPGHVLKNDKETGESLIKCGDGVLALLQCRYEESSEAFSPGKKWRSIRMRLGVRVEDWLWTITKQRKN